MSESLIFAHFLFFGERCEWIAQVTHQKWANEWIAQFFERIAQSLILGQKMSDSLRNQMSEFPALFFSYYSSQTISSSTPNVYSPCSHIFSNYLFSISPSLFSNIYCISFSYSISSQPSLLNNLFYPSILRQSLTLQPSLLHWSHLQWSLPQPPHFQ